MDSLSPLLRKRWQHLNSDSEMPIRTDLNGMVLPANQPLDIGPFRKKQRSRVNRPWPGESRLRKLLGNACRRDSRAPGLKADLSLLVHGSRVSRGCPRLANPAGSKSISMLAPGLAIPTRVQSLDR